jgi:inorganic pyrophosphatase
MGPSCYTGSVAHSSPLAALPREPEVLIESPRWSLIKRRSDGSVDFIAPLPCPYNYGCIPGLDSGDGDPLDVVVLGPRLRRGERVRMQVVGVIGFLDAGCSDPKVVCSPRPLRALERVGLAAFFRLYALFKRVLHLVRGQGGRETRYLGWLEDSGGGGNVSTASNG